MLNVDGAAFRTAQAAHQGAVEASHVSLDVLSKVSPT
jgi:hypothetical protein